MNKCFIDQIKVLQTTYEIKEKQRGPLTEAHLGPIKKIFFWNS